jgi:hypothetical protein
VAQAAFKGDRTVAEWASAFGGNLTPPQVARPRAATAAAPNLRSDPARSLHGRKLCPSAARQLARMVESIRPVRDVGHK